MLTYASPTPEHIDEFLQMMWDDGQEYMENTLQLMEMTWEQYSQIFRTRGQVRAILQDGALAGFYWIEERDDTLHLHGLILKPASQGQGIGTMVLTMLADSYTGKMNRIELGVYQSNTRAISLYQRQGYEITKNLAELRFYVMQKPLISTTSSSNLGHDP
jgi:ribosomal protein S18 acetylase RimI-like enzyme